MTHRILLREVVIDVPSHQVEAAKQFWAAALDADARQLKDYTEFIALHNPAARCVVGLQDIGDAAARLHIDIESDDVEAEVDRLVALGAAVERRHREWVVLRDPVGLLLCVVPPDSPDFADHARSIG